MDVEINCFGPVRDEVGEKTVALSLADDATVGDALAALVDDHPALDGVVLSDGEVAGGVNVTKNGANVSHEDGVATPLSDGDTLRISPPVKGGSGARC